MRADNDPQLLKDLARMVELYYKFKDASWWPKYIYYQENYKCFNRYLHLEDDGVVALVGWAMEEYLYANGKEFRVVIVQHPANPQEKWYIDDGIMPPYIYKRGESRFQVLADFFEETQIEVKTDV